MKERRTDEEKTATLISSDSVNTSEKYATQIRACVDKQDFSNLQIYIQLHAWQQEGVEASLESRNKFPTGVGFVRTVDAGTVFEGKLIKEVLPIDPLAIKKDNALLRMLSTMRGINHLLDHKISQSENKAIYQLAKNHLIIQFTNLIKTLSTVTVTEQADLKKLEINFNTALLQILSGAGLLQGVKDSKQAKELLLHYRYLAGVLDPAKTLETRTSFQVEKAGKEQSTQVTFVDVADPITQKTTAQTASLDLMKVVGEKIKNEKDDSYNYHTAQSVAFQEANAAFRHQLKEPNTQLSAQLRKRIAPGLKNAFITHEELIVDGVVKDKSPDSMRMGSPVYVGKGNKEYRQLYTQQNLQVLFESAQEKPVEGAEKKPMPVPVHLLCLLTDIHSENQPVIIQETERAKDALNSKGDKSFFWTHIPVNAVRLLAPGKEISSLIPKGSAGATHAPDVMKSSAIIQGAVNNLLLQEEKSAVDVTFCASGQDRTGTTKEYQARRWFQRVCHDRALTITDSLMDELRQAAAHNAFLATHAAPGSPGMKIESQDSSLFSGNLYREEANTNKKAPISERFIASFLTKPSDSFARAEIAKARKKEDYLRVLSDYVVQAIYYQNEKPIDKKLFENTQEYKQRMDNRKEIIGQLQNVLNRISEELMKPSVDSMKLLSELGKMVKENSASTVVTGFHDLIARARAKQQNVEGLLIDYVAEYLRAGNHKSPHAEYLRNLLYEREEKLRPSEESQKQRTMLFPGVDKVGDKIFQHIAKNYPNIVEQYARQLQAANTDKNMPATAIKNLQQLFIKMGLPILATDSLNKREALEKWLSSHPRQSQLHQKQNS